MRVLTHFSLENFRLFKEKTSFDLAPITVLTGTNSSGKSSLIKAILLLKNNFEKNKSIEEIDFSIGDHNLNDFKNSLNYDSVRDIMYFSFSCYVNNLGVRLIELGYQLDRENGFRGKLNSFSIFGSKGEAILSAFKDFDDEIGGNITYRIDVNYFIENLDDEVISKNIKKRIYDDPDRDWVEKFFLTNKDELFMFDSDSEDRKVYKEALEELKTNGFKKNTGWTKSEMLLLDQSSIVNGLGVIGREVIGWLELNLKHRGFQLKRTDYGIFFLEDFSEYIINNTVKQVFYNFEAISHFASLRSDSRKYYTKEDGEIFELLVHYSKERKKFNPEIKGFVKSQLQAYALGEKVKIKNHKNILAEVFVNREGKKVLLSDLGFGYTQLLPIILKIALIAHLSEKDERFFLTLPGEVYEPSYWDSFFLLEEPESNLHPAFQSKIAEMIAYAAAKFRIRFVVETHSEYLIRNLQYLIAKKTLINPEAVKIYYFNKPGSEEAEESLFRTIQIESNGRMTRGFGSGFFDEAESIAFELFMLNQNRQN